MWKTLLLPTGSSAAGVKTVKMSSDPVPGLKIDILISSDAESFTDDKEVRKKWQALYDKCPWATVFQSVDFVTTWYAIYDKHWSPAIVAGTRSDGSLAGLLTLAISKATGELVCAGAHHAEYQAWLADPDLGNLFIESALEALRAKFPRTILTFLFVPPNTPIEWASGNSSWCKHCITRSVPRNLMVIGDGSALNSALKKKNIRNHVNRLKKIGDLRFERITDPKELELVFDEIMTYATFRLGALFDTPLQVDGLKKPFYLAMMRIPRLLHATVLKIDDQIISANIGMYNSDQVLMGIFVHSPFLAKQSPGVLHLLMLGVELAKEGVPTLDLTPGGGYKDRFATCQDKTYVLTVFFSRVQYAQHKAKRKILESAKSVLQAANITQSQVLGAKALLKHKWSNWRVTTLPAKLYKLISRHLWGIEELRVYSYDIEMARNLVVQPVMKNDYLPHLLAYKPAEAWQPPTNLFLKQAMKNLESGDHVYTHVENNQLIHYGWLIERQKSVSLGTGSDFPLPPDSVLLTDYYTHPAARGKGLYRQSLSQMLHDAATIPGTKNIYIAVLANNLPSRHVIEKVGFTYQFSLFSKRLPWRTDKWNNAPRPPIRADLSS